MSHETKYRRPYEVLVGMVLTLTSGVASGSQLSADQGGARIGVAGGSPSLLKAGPLGELISVFTPRDPDEIHRRLEFARTNQENAERDIDANNRLVQEAEGRVKISSEEVDTTKTRISVAGKAKNKTDKAMLKIELKRQEAEKNYLGILLGVAKADASWLDRQKSAAEARVKALEIESDITKKYAEIRIASTDKAADTSSYREILRQLLDAQQKAADRTEDAASAEKEASSRRVKQLDTLAKLKP